MTKNWVEMCIIIEQQDKLQCSPIMQQKVTKMTEIQKFPKLMSVTQFCETFPVFSRGSIRNILFYEDMNGLKTSGATKRLGRKILIDCEKFFSWLDGNPSITGRGN